VDSAGKGEAAAVPWQGNLLADQKANKCRVHKVPEVASMFGSNVGRKGAHGPRERETGHMQTRKQQVLTTPPGAAGNLVKNKVRPLSYPRLEVEDWKLSGDGMCQASRGKEGELVLPPEWDERNGLLREL
jgi:hypothetical protein